MAGSVPAFGRYNSSTGNEARLSIASCLLAAYLTTLPDELPPTAGAGGTTRRWRSIRRCRMISSESWEVRPWQTNLNPSNRPVRTRMPGGVAGDADYLRAPMPIVRFFSDYFATRSWLSCVPIVLNAVTIWVELVSWKNLSVPLAQFCNTVEVGSAGVW